MRKHFGTFLQGLAVVVPLAFTIYVFVAIVAWLDAQMFRLVGAWVPSLPGLGAVLGLLLVYAVGLLTRLVLFRQLVASSEAMIGRVPLVKTLYGSVRDLMQYFQRGDDKPKGEAVRVRLSEDAHVIGIVTSNAKSEDGRVGVYLPLSYQIGGYLVYLPRERLTPLDMDVEAALKLVLTGGMSASTEESTLARLPPTF